MTSQPETTAARDADAIIEREVRIAASPAVVFEYFVDPARMIRWMGRSADLQPTPGGRFHIDYNGTDIVSGAFLEVDPPRRVVFSWGWEMPGDPVGPGASTVEVTLTPDGDGTRLQLRHSGLSSGSIDGHAEGWDYFLPTLASDAEVA